jgi:hypothetical protein
VHRVPHFRRSWLRTVFAFVVVGGASWPLVYFVAMTVVPPRTPDGHPVMPIGQVFFATLASPLVGVAAGWGFGRTRATR